MSLTEKAMLAKISCSIIGQKKKDDIATTKANNALNTSQQAGMYMKCKISRENIIDVLRARDKATALHRKMTTPFTSDGWGLISADLVIEYGRHMSNFKIEFEAAVGDFVRRWVAVVAFESNRLGPLFNQNEYPSQGVVADEFLFYHRLKPVPDEGHIILDLEAEDLEEIKSQLKKENDENLKRSMKDMWNRLFDPVANMADICSNDKKVFGSLITKLEDIVDILPTLNIIHDADLNVMAQEIKYKLLGHTVGQIKDDKKLKKKLGKEAEDLADKVRNFMGSVPVKK
jgi:hypothetical protein